MLTVKTICGVAEMEREKERRVGWREEQTGKEGESPSS